MPHEPRRHRRSGSGRRSLPPAATGREALYLDEVKLARRPVTLFLADGSELRGTVEYFDRHMVKITRDEGPNLLVRKSDIRFVREEG